MTLTGGLPSEPRVERNLIDMTNREYIDREIESLRREIERALAAHQRDHDAHATEHLVHADAHAREHTASNLAILKAEEGLLLRFEAHNKFREQMEKLIATFATIVQFDQFSKNVDEQLRKLHDGMLHAVTRESFDDRLNALSGKLDTTTKAIDDKVAELRLTVNSALGGARGISLAWGAVVILISIGIGMVGLLR